jgi:hypothetical protein
MPHKQLDIYGQPTYGDPMQRADQPTQDEIDADADLRDAAIEAFRDMRIYMPDDPEYAEALERARKHNA